MSPLARSPSKVKDRRAESPAMIAALAALALLAGCAFPTRDQSKLKAIKAESEALMATHPIKPPKLWVEIPRSQETPIIASLQPYSVMVREWGVDILMKPDFDGGWGYHVPRDKRDLPMPAWCYSDLGEGVFWHNPC
jgi:hypothetical protein